MRAAYYRILNTVAETGTATGNKALINTMNYHLERTASHLFSPTELKFACDFDNAYKPDVIKRGEVFAKHLTRQWEHSSTDMLFGQGVFEALKYGLVAPEAMAAQRGTGGQAADRLREEGGDAVEFRLLQGKRDRHRQPGGHLRDLAAHRPRGVAAHLAFPQGQGVVREDHDALQEGSGSVRVPTASSIKFCRRRSCKPASSHRRARCREASCRSATTPTTR